MHAGKWPTALWPGFFCTSGDAMCAARTGHLLPRFETPRTQEAKKEKTAKPKTTPNTKTQQQKQKTASENIGVSSLYV